jgi:hypothetical protein
MPTADGISAGRPLTVEVLSSAPPAKPAVLQLLPLIRYVQTRADDGTTTSTREGLGLRVWLARPWFSSGAGELLAVVCDRGGQVTANSELSREITMIVQDPAHASVMPQPLTAGAFRNAELIRENVRLSEFPISQDIAAFRPVWDSHRQAWYCDIEFPTGAAYFPFVRLGLVRYQPHAIPGCELSPIVPTAFVQTVPDRTLNCVFEPDGSTTLALNGPAPSASMDAGGVATAGSNLVVAVVEVQEPAIADPLLGWAAASPETELASVLNGDGTATWNGAVQLPDAGGRRLRLAVREYEIHASDDRSAEPSPGLVATRRLVHADIIPLATQAGTRLADFLILLDSTTTDDDVEAVSDMVQAGGGRVLDTPAPILILAQGDEGVQTELLAADPVVGLFPTELALVAGALLVEGVAAADLVALLSGLTPTALVPEALADTEDVPVAAGSPLDLLQSPT